MPMSKDDRARLIGILYLSALFGGTDAVELSNNIRRLILELRTAIYLLQLPEMNDDIRVIERSTEEWRMNIANNLDKDHIAVSAYSYTILDELSVLVEGRYGKVDFNDYTKIMRSSTEAT